MDTRWSRVLRGLVAGVAATLVAAVSHTLAGDHAPSVAGLALAIFFSAIVSIALAGRALSFARLAASVVVSQLGFHLVFSTVGGAGEVISSGHHSQTITSGGEAIVHASHSMWLAHGIAAVVTVLALRFAESAFYGLRDTAGMLLNALLRPAAAITVAVDRTPLPAPVLHLVPRIVRDFHAALGLRGPPPLLRGA